MKKKGLSLAVYFAPEDLLVVRSRFNISSKLIRKKDFRKRKKKEKDLKNEIQY